ncbi:hypothetical protein C5167_034846 [Papaver somniferum]|uniref:Uncharacterized protein n=1 Tax=Papaver somniferum TaxID=3469 RepID=A0A4Y7KFQ0_PAPSO|nr:hypothetical protein C5167_034846 [Papaver somniferum]
MRLPSSSETPPSLNQKKSNESNGNGFDFLL